MAKRIKIEPSIILTIYTNNLINIPIIISTNTGKILHMTHINKNINQHYYFLRKHLIERLDNLISQYNVNTILLEQNQLFIDTIGRYPDPFVLKNIILGYSINISIEDNYFEKVKYIMEIPRYEWKKEVLNKKVDYAIDLYKSHILIYSDYDKEDLKRIDDNNYYEALCFSESIRYDKFLNKQYLVNYIEE